MRLDIGRVPSAGGGSFGFARLGFGGAARGLQAQLLGPGDPGGFLALRPLGRQHALVIVVVLRDQDIDHAGLVTIPAALAFRDLGEEGRVDRLAAAQIGLFLFFMDRDQPVLQVADALNDLGLDPEHFDVVRHRRLLARLGQQPGQGLKDLAIFGPQPVRDFGAVVGGLLGIAADHGARVFNVAHRSSPSEGLVPRR